MSHSLFVPLNHGRCGWFSHVPSEEDAEIRSFTIFVTLNKTVSKDTHKFESRGSKMLQLRGAVAALVTERSLFEYRPTFRDDIGTYTLPSWNQHFHGKLLGESHFAILCILLPPKFPHVSLQNPKHSAVKWLEVVSLARRNEDQFNVQ